MRPRGRIWRTILSTARFDGVIEIAGVALPVEVRRYAASKGYRLRLDGGRKILRLSIPPRASVERALSWARGQEDWLKRQWERVQETLVLADGVTFPLEGEQITVRWRSDAVRKPQLDGNSLIVGGPVDALGPRALRWLKERARETLARETRELADHHGLRVASVAIGDPRSRWGSCTSGGAIRYSWRLILAPSYVRRSTVAHEVAHLLHMDHSAAFHAAHARLLGSDPAAAREWLRRNGMSLHAVTA
jgi:predicted metal-dependent hydrolase